MLLLLIIGLMVGSILVIPLIRPYLAGSGKGGGDTPAIIQQPDPQK
jgi:hypothetical protein